ncbi:MAG: hypothetical protein A2V60_00085 [Candidatus Portnoybacteria bacterium RIFCSPHIGHO2_01_FULL_39_19]|nr:MAG: hypothetical protein A2V60_00085 [Candidatus Portnoybacteria bacterium RIFCSPHIGHO2_01_FULL_39_19]
MKLMNQLTSLGNLNITSWEVVILLFLVGGGFLLGILLGRDRVFVLLLGSYISFALMGVIPFKKIFPDFFGNEENFVVLIVTFLVLIGIIYFLLSRSILKSKRTGNKYLFQIFFLSVFFIGIVTSVVFMFFPKDLIKAFSPAILKIFNTSTARFLWLVIPLIFVGIFKGRKPSIKEKKSI